MVSMLFNFFNWHIIFKMEWQIKQTLIEIVWPFQKKMTIPEKHISGINTGLERVGSLKDKWINKWALQSDWE